jgi:hypothetical protein
MRRFIAVAVLLGTVGYFEGPAIAQQVSVMGQGATAPVRVGADGDRLKEQPYLRSPDGGSVAPAGTAQGDLYTARAGEAMNGPSQKLQCNPGGDAGIPVVPCGVDGGQGKLAGCVNYNTTAMGADIYYALSNNLPDAGAGGVYATLSSSAGSNGTPVIDHIPMAIVFAGPGDNAELLMCISSSGTPWVYFTPIVSGVGH